MIIKEYKNGINIRLPSDDGGKANVYIDDERIWEYYLKNGMEFVKLLAFNGKL